MQKMIEEKTDLLTKDGKLNCDGYCKKMIVNYNRDAVKNKRRLKEWDYYYVADSHFALCLTISNLSFAGVLSASVIDFRTGKHYDKTSLALFPKIKPELPLSSVDGKSHYKTKDAEFTFEVSGGKRHLFGSYKNFFKDYGTDLDFDVVLSEEPKESMVKVTPFKNPSHFYFNQKINCMLAEGVFTFQGKNYSFDKYGTLATLDWGRGVLPYRTKWYWASMNCAIHGGRVVGFNLGKALGDNTKATENMIFVDGKAHKLENVSINIQRKNKKRDYLGTWTFYSDDGKLELMFEPIVDRYCPFNALVVAFIPHQVFGRYTGKLKLDSGDEIIIENQLGFAERVVNRW